MLDFLSTFLLRVQTLQRAIDVKLSNQSRFQTKSCDINSFLKFWQKKPCKSIEIAKFIFITDEIFLSNWTFISSHNQIQNFSFFFFIPYLSASGVKAHEMTKTWKLRLISKQIGLERSWLCVFASGAKQSSWIIFLDCHTSLRSVRNGWKKLLFITKNL